MRGNISLGIGYLIRGVRLMRTPKLMLFILVPLVINAVVFASLIFWTISYFGSLIPQWMEAIPGWLTFIEWLIWPLLILLFSLLTGYFFTAVTLMIASPFNSLLAEKVEEYYTGCGVRGYENLWSALVAVPLSLVRELRKVTYYLPMAIAVFICSWLPGINIIAPALWFLLGAWMMSLQFLDYPLDNHRLDFRDVVAFAGQQRLTTLGFGGSVAVCVSIPLLNLIIVPAAVAGATLLYCDTREQG
jgi:CysZ protein